jgi:hypothetical protein
LTSQKSYENEFNNRYCEKEVPQEIDHRGGQNDIDIHFNEFNDEGINDEAADHRDPNDRGQSIPSFYFFRVPLIHLIPQSSTTIFSF